MNSSLIDPGSAEVLTQATAEEVLFVQQGGDADPGGVPATGRVEANSLRLNVIAKGNKPADMPGSMTESICALHANIGREHGFDSRGNKTSPGFPDSSTSSSLESVAELKGRVLYGTKEVIGQKLYLYTDDTVYEVGASFNTNGTAEYEIHRNKATDHHYTVFTNYVLTGSDDIHVTGHTGKQQINMAFDLNVVGAQWYEQDPPVMFYYAGNSGNNTFDMTWGFFKIDLSVGGNNRVNMNGGISGEVIGGSGNDTIFCQPTFESGGGIHADLSAGGDNTVILHGAASSVTLGAGNDMVEVTNQWNNGGHPGNWSVATIDLSLGGTNTVDIRGDTHTSGPTVAHITLGLGNSTILAHDHTVVTILGANSTGNHTITLNGSAGRQGEVHAGQGHMDLTLNAGVYDIHLGTGSVSMSVNGHQGFSTIYDADGNLIVGRVDGQSSVAQAVHTFSAGEGINLDYSLKLGYGVDKVQFFAGSGHYQVTSSANGDIFELDFEAGGTEGATFEVFDFKWGTDRIMAADGTVFDELLLSDGHPARLQYLGEENGQHVFDVVAVRSFGAYEAGHVWMTVYSRDLPDLNFV